MQKLKEIITDEESFLDEDINLMEDILSFESFNV